mgnify:CR=1 FL=1
MAVAATGTGDELPDDDSASTFTADTLRSISDETCRKKVINIYGERLGAIYRECLLPAAKDGKSSARFDFDMRTDHEVMGVPDYKVMEILRERGFKITRYPANPGSTVATCIISWSSI